MDYESWTYISACVYVYQYQQVGQISFYQDVSVMRRLIVNVNDSDYSNDFMKYQYIDKAFV